MARPTIATGKQPCPICQGGVPSKHLPRLFDHRVGTCEQCGRRFEAERLGSLEVDHEIEPRGLFDRQVTRIYAAEDLLHKIGCSHVELALGWAVTSKARELGIFRNRG